jgi:nitrate reductase NapE component
MFDGGAGALVSGFLTLGLLMAIVAVITGRRLPDEAAIRPRAIYLSVAMLPVLVVGVLAATAFLEAAVQLILGPESSAEDLLGGLAGGGLPGGDMGSLGGLLTGMGDLGLSATDAAIRTLVASGITAVVAFAIYRLHQEWRDPLAESAGFLGSPAARVLQAFAYTVVLIFVVLLAVSAVKAGYGIFRVVAPGTSAILPISETAERERGIADIVSGLALAGASWWLLQMHWRLAAAWRGEAATPAVPEPPAA